MLFLPIVSRYVSALFRQDWQEVRDQAGRTPTFPFMQSVRRERTLSVWQVVRPLSRSCSACGESAPFRFGRSYARFPGWVDRKERAESSQLD